MTTLNLDQPILWLSPQDTLTVRQLMEGVLVLGSSGSGKSSGPGRMLLSSMMRAGFGGLVLTVKPTDTDDVVRIARETGREHQLIIVSPEKKWRFDALAYECSRPGKGAGLTENISTLLNTLIELGERQERGGSSEQYWQRATQQLIRHAIEINRASTGTVSIASIHEIVRTAPISGADVESDSWRSGSFLFRSIMAAEERNLSSSQRKDFEYAAKFFLSEWPYLAEKTRSVITSTLTGILDPFQRGILRELFCSGQTNFVPELCFLRGAIIVIDLPVKEFADLGRYAQVLFKAIWQKTMERRSVVQNPNPVFFYSDEFQETVVEADRQFQATSRSSRVCSVYLTQNLPTIYASIGGGEAAKQTTDAFLGNLNTKLFLCNGDPVTNEWAAQTFGKCFQHRMNFGYGSAPSSEAYSIRRKLEDRQANASVSEQLDYLVQPMDFTTLQKGGPPYHAAEGWCFQGGRHWVQTGSTAMRVLFPQR